LVKRLSKSEVVEIQIPIVVGENLPRKSVPANATMPHPGSANLLETGKPSIPRPLAGNGIDPRESKFVFFISAA
jgi:hypothetical protein